MATLKSLGQKSGTTVGTATDGVRVENGIIVEAKMTANPCLRMLLGIAIITFRRNEEVVTLRRIRHMQFEQIPGSFRG